jgi:hypothetical protein
MTARKASPLPKELHNRRHGHCGNPGHMTPTYNSWRGMKRRCRAPNKHYVGVKLCRRWESFELFLLDMGERPPGKTLDRRRPAGNYTPANCRWATYSEQRRNRR